MTDDKDHDSFSFVEQRVLVLVLVFILGTP